LASLLFDGVSDKPVSTILIVSYPVLIVAACVMIYLI